MDGTVYLISESYDVDALGQRIPVEHCREVFASVSSVSRSEWVSGGKLGLQPELTVTMPKVNYCGEKTVAVDCRRYSVYRSYYRGDSDEIELYLEEKAGS